MALAEPRLASRSICSVPIQPSHERHRGAVDGRRQDPAAGHTLCSGPAGAAARTGYLDSMRDRRLRFPDFPQSTLTGHLARMRPRPHPPSCGMRRVSSPPGTHVS